jgi:hypothetical protein
MTTSPSETTVEDVKPKRIRKPRQVRITATEAEVAKRLNVPLEKLAEQKMKASRVKRKAFKRTPKEQALFDQLLNDNMAFIAQNNNHIKEILELKHQINGFRAVISYLEHHCGLRSSQ